MQADTTIQHEHVLEIAEGTAKAMTRRKLEEREFEERRDLQEWVVDQPQVLGDDVMIVATQYTGWQTSTGITARDEADVIGIDSSGQLVIAELKRASADKQDRHAELQAIKYAALASNFSEATLIEAHVDWMRTRGEQMSEDEARKLLKSHTGNHFNPNCWRKPRIVLLAESFAPVLLEAVEWLAEFGIEITLMRHQLYASSRQSSEADVLVVSQAYPVPSGATQPPARQGPRAEAASVVLCRRNAFPKGLPLKLAPKIRRDLIPRIEELLVDNPAMATGKWIGDQANSVILWDHEGPERNASNAPKEIVTEIGLKDEIGRLNTNGTEWWRTAVGDRTLAEVADMCRAAEDELGKKFEVLHDLLGGVPEGRWIDCADLAKFYKIALLPLQRHLVTCSQCLHGLEILTKKGELAENYASDDPTDPKARLPAFAARGIGVRPDGADLEAKLTADNKWDPSAATAV